jgi:hypothetical protein
VAAIGTWLLAGSIVFTVLQLRQMRLSTNAPLVGDLFREVRSEETLETLRFIYSFAKPITHKDVGNLLPVNRNRIQKVLDQHDMLGALARHGLVGKELVIEAYVGGSVIRCWYQLRDYVEKERYYRGSNYLENFEDLASYTLEYVNKRKEEFPEQEWLWFCHGEEAHKAKRINIREELNKENLKPKPFKKGQRVVKP